MKRVTAGFALLLILFLLGACSAPKRPDWLRGQSSLYPPQSYLIGIGTDTQRSRAEDRARSEIAKTFEVEIAATFSSEESHWLAQGTGTDGETYEQQVREELAASTHRMISGVRIAEVWFDDKNESYSALAVLDRVRAARPLRSEIEEIDQRLLARVKAAGHEGSPFLRLGIYLQALADLERRKGLAVDLQIVDVAGWVSPPSVTVAEVESQANRVARELTIGLKLGNDSSGIVKGALLRSLAELGLKVTSQEKTDLLLRGAVTVESYDVPPPWKWRVASAQVEFVDGSGAMLDAVRASVREGSQIATRAETMAREKLGEKLATLLLRRIFEEGRRYGR
ncbi:MAG: hypothetical protein C0621_08165 [Desulfuromonas sp.]|nr:MAG: hypothetical protein C0621_08165 [Desulfuromonas sp.]